MSQQDHTQYLRKGDKFIAYKSNQVQKNQMPHIVFLHGLYSDMEGSKCLFLHEKCQQNEVSFTRFDNYGHGESAGEFSECVISDWQEGADDIINNITGDILLIGSSMGGWLALNSAIKHDKVKGLLLIAPAPDFTENLMWQQFTEQERQVLTQQGVLQKSPEHYPITHNLIMDGRKHLLLDQDKINVNCPVHILHAINDDVVPYDISNQIITKIASQNTTLKFTNYGGHRMSDEASLQLLWHSIVELSEQMK